jgi:hypothetical protein
MSLILHSVVVEVSDFTYFCLFLIDSLFIFLQLTLLFFVVSVDVLDLSFSMVFTTTVYFNQTHAQALAVAIANFMNISRDRVIVTIISVTSIQKREVKFHSQGSGFNVEVEVTILEGTPQQQQNEPPPDQVITDFLNQLQNNHTVFETQYQNTPGSPPNGISFVLAAPNPTGTEQNGVPLNPRMNGFPFEVLNSIQFFVSFVELKFSEHLNCFHL